MRMRDLGRDERGATAVFILICLVVLVALVALSIDGGLLYSRLRQVRRANDAAALAAAIECVTNSGAGVAGANTKANQYAIDNGADGTPYQPNAYPNGCAPTGGKVTVYYGKAQELVFGPALGITSPKQVARSATAVWGPAGGTDGIAPLMLSANRLSSPCQIPNNVTVGQKCGFWFNNSNQGNNTTNQDLMNAEWGWMDLSRWDVGQFGGCSGNSSSNDISSWLTNGYPGDLVLNPTPPTYVCRGNGNMSSLFNPNGAVTAALGRMLAFPVNDPSKQVDSSGAVCAPNTTTNCSVAKYAIVGFASLQLLDVYRGNTPEAAQYCPGHPSDSNARCLVAVWQGFQTGGVVQNGGQNFGLIAVGLAG